MLSVIYNIIIKPIELIVEFVFELMFRILGQRQTNQGLAVIGVSIAISFLTLPLYRRADAVQQKERDTQKKLSKWVNHIKKTFKGDERFMMLQTYYKENGYSPIQALNGSLSLLLEIPFFIAAYHFLSNLEVLNGASFGPFSDLGVPDSLFSIGNFKVNVLPIAMTIINCISSAIYLKGFPLKDKLQTYGMALIFLVLLYNSPAGLVVYWTCNNIFGLIKNIFYKLKHPRKVFNLLSAFSGSLFAIVVFVSGILNSKKKIIAIILFMILTWIPLLLSIIAKNKTKDNKEPNINVTPTSKNFIYYSGIFITVLLGILIPSSVIASSPAEFVNIQHYQNPLRYVLYTFSYSAGFFILWTGIIYNILQPKARKIFSVILYAASIIFIINFLFFQKKLGNLTSLLAYEDGYIFSMPKIVINSLVTISLIVFSILTFKFSKNIKIIYLILIISISGVSIRNIYHANKLLSDMSYIKNNDSSFYTHKKIIPLSKNGKNVIVFMLDRAINGYFPYFLEEKPELKEQFSGFTYYPNTLSYGNITNIGAPALFGGYEYSVEKMNNRSNDFLADKHNEALKVLPWLFDEAGFQVTVCDPPYAGYKEIPDLSIFDEKPNINKYITIGQIDNESLIDPDFIRKSLTFNDRNFFFYSLIRTSPLFLSIFLYDDAHYMNSQYVENSYDSRFYNNYAVLTLLSEITYISDTDKNTYLAINNEITHAPTLLQLPDYTLEKNVDNTGYKTAAEGKIPMEKEEQVNHYYVNMAAILQLGKWFDYLKKNNVYDNTRIIIAADHGRNLAQFNDLFVEKYNLDVQNYNPLFLVKDFGSQGDITTDHSFMTNADTPSIATSGLIENPVNPFTGNKISSDEKFEHPQIITTSHHWDITENNGKTFDTSDGVFYSVHDNIFDNNNWEKVK